MNMLQTIVPRSDQINSDDLIAGPMTIKVTEVRFKSDDQPVLIHFEGDNQKPYKPCKSMRRVLVHAWGPDANKYVGRSMTLCRDPSVKWAGEAVGGIRISHLSHIEKPFTMALTATRGSRKPYTVDALAVSLAPTVAEYERCDGAQYKLLEARRKEHWGSLSKPQRDELEAAKKAAFDRLASAAKATAKPAEPAAEASAQANQAQQFDPVAALQQLTTPADAAALDATWSAVVEHYGALDLEIPIEHHAAYTISKEQFAQ